MKKAQSLIEFTLVFALFMSIILLLIDRGLYMRAKWQLETITNEVMANTQNQKRISCKQVSVNEFSKRLTLITPQNIEFECEENGTFQHCTSNIKSGDVPVFMFNINCPLKEKEPVTLYIQYNFTGLLRRQTIISSFNSSTPKF